MSALSETATAAIPSRWTTIPTGLFAFMMVWVRSIWLHLNHLDTAAHEGGHALAAFLTGRSVLEVRIESDGSGSTWYYGSTKRAGLVVIAASGYTAPSLFGLASAALLAAGNITADLIIVGVALLTLLLQVDNGFGVFVVVMAGGALAVVARHSGAAAQVAFACTATWFLLFSGIRSLGVLRRARRHNDTNDADALGRLTHLPGGVWLAAFYAINVYCLLFGARLLLKGP
jgi:hypothetical protein